MASAYYETSSDVADTRVAFGAGWRPSQVPQSAYAEYIAPRPSAYTENIVDDDIDEVNVNLTNFLKAQLASGIDHVTDETIEVVETLAQHKYSQLANASYTHFNTKGDVDAVHEGLRDENFAYIDDLADFEVDESLSTRDNLVLHNEVTGETHIAYRGTTDKVSGQFFEDWTINGQITGGSTHTTRVNQAQEQFDEVASKYGKENLSVSGHSQGGHVSYEIGVKNDVPGYHYNPAINTTQVNEAGQYAGNVAEQAVFKQPLDFASPLAYHKDLAKSNTKVNIVHNLHGKDSVIETHSIDNFAPTPKEVVGDVVVAERRTLAGSVVKGAGHIAGVGLTAYSFAEDVKKDNSVVEVAVDAGKQAEMYVVDTEIMTAGLALAPETMGASVVVAMGATIINDMMASHTADYVKEEIPEVKQAFKETGKKIGRFFKKLF